MDILVSTITEGAIYDSVISIVKNRIQNEFDFYFDTEYEPIANIGHYKCPIFVSIYSKIFFDAVKLYVDWETQFSLSDSDVRRVIHDLNVSEILVDVLENNVSELAHEITFTLPEYPKS